MRYYIVVMKSRYLISLVLLLSFIEIRSATECDGTFTDASALISHVVTLEWEEQEFTSCKWKIMTNQNEILYLDSKSLKNGMSGYLENFNKKEDKFKLEIYQKVGQTAHKSLVFYYLSSSKRSLNASMPDQLWISPGGEVDVFFSFSKNAYREWDKIHIPLLMHYKTILPSANRCKHIIKIQNQNSTTITFPSENDFGTFQSGVIGCTWLLEAERRMEIRLDLDSKNGTYLDIHDVQPKKSSLIFSSRSSEMPAFPIVTSHNAILVFWKLLPESSLIPNGKITVNVVPQKPKLLHFKSNYTWDCEFTDGICSWKHNDSLDGQWLTDSDVIEIDKHAARGTKAILISPIISTEQKQMCVKVSYVMDGAVAYSLRIRLHSAKNASQTILFVKGSQGKEFMHAQFELPSSLTDNFLTLEAIRGYSTEGTVAVDHIRTTKGKCKTDDGFACNFEEGLCGWKQDDRDLGNWFSNQSFGLYSPKGMVPRLISPVFKASPNSYCLEIGYDGYGNLSIYQKNEHSNVTTHVEDLHADLNKHKIKANVQLTAQSPFSLILEGRSDNSSVELALDSISISNVSCGIDCEFSGAICTWRTIGKQIYLGNDSIVMNPQYTSDSNSLISQEITSTAKKFFCFKYVIDFYSPIFLELSSVDSHAKDLSLWKEFSKKAENSTFLTDCVKLPDKGIFKLIFATYTNPLVSGDDNAKIPIDTKLKISKVWTEETSVVPNKFDCPFTTSLCGWHQSSYADVIWMTSSKFERTIIAIPINKMVLEPGYFYSPITERSTESDKQCLKFAYTVQESVIETITPKMQLDGSSNTLEISLTTPGGKDMKSLWKQVLYSANAGPFMVNVPVEVPKIFQIVLFAALYDTKVLLHNLTLSESCFIEFDCTFNEGFCSWITGSHEEKYKYSWTWVPTDNHDPRLTGPVIGSDFSKGRFVVSNSSLPGRIAELISPVRFPEDKNHYFKNGECLVFQYYMFGVNVDKLEVHVRQQNMNNAGLLWSKVGNQGNIWCRVQIPLNVTTSYRITFTSHRGNGNLGDIALDDVKMLSEHCEKSEECKDES